MIRRSLRHAMTALILLVAFTSQVTWTLAGTTGGLTGTVIDADTSAPVAGAQVTVASPSQTATATTDASGRFSFLTLAPDTYTVSAEKTGYQSISVPGQTVFADTVQTVAVRLPKSLKTIAHVTSTAVGSLVKSGTTADVYSVNAARQAAAATLGGGGSLNSAYSAIATVPGAYVIPNQTGYYQTVHIRGGDYDQVGYEFDGVPVNRSFDNYPSSSASSLGNAEVQVYTGANPANSEGEGLAGYINQVIKSGTFPGYAVGSLGIGTPAYYHRAAVEVGGSTPDRNFSYYVGIGGYNQDFNYLNNQNGSQFDNISGVWLSPCGGQTIGNCDGTGIPNSEFADGGYNTGPLNYSLLSNISARDVVANVHIGIPHHRDAGRDDIQLLWDSESLHNNFYSTTNDIASPGCPSSLTGASCANYIGLGQPTYYDGFQWNCGSSVGQTFTRGGLNATGPGCTGTYYYPNSTNRTAPGQPIPVNASDTVWNDQEIAKLAYTKNFSSSAFLRLYGYTYYSDWMQNGPQTTYSDWYACCSPDYELSAHTRGASLQFQDQLNAQNLLTLQGNYVTSSTVRDNNTQMVNFAPPRAYAAVAVNAADPYGGYCYNSTSVTTCNPGGGAIFATWAQLQSGTAPGLPKTCPDPNVTSSQCRYLLAENSQWATYNNVQPEFAAVSLTDQFRPSDKWLFNLGVRGDSFTFLDGNANINNNGGIARQFWYNAYNIDTCVNNLTGVPVDKTQLASPIPVTAACPSGYHGANLQNIASQNFTFNVWQPRVAGTYTVDPESVIRFSYGRYTEAPNSAYEIYNTLETDMPFELLGPNLYPYGRNSPGLAVYPPTSLNYDLTWEHRFKGTAVSFSVTPFLRQTQNQVQDFFLNQQTAFVSGLNVGSQRSEGVEFQLQDGDFSRNGFSGQVSFTYTNSYINYGKLSNGTTIISPINAAIGQYNSYTRACAPGGAFYGKSQYGQPLCAGTSSGKAYAAKCYIPTFNGSGGVSGATPAACSAPGAYANPYWNMSAQSLINPSQNFSTYSIFPAGIGSSASAYGVPYVATLLLNYKMNKFAITPSFQFLGGGKYGAPETTPGIDPAAGCSAIAGTSRYDASTCLSTVVIPDPYTGVFDNLGSFTQPNEFILNLQLTYEATPRITLVAALGNIVNTCWGGTKAPWTLSNNQVCGYGIVGNGGVTPVGNLYNPPGTPGNKWTQVQPFRQYPYGPIWGPYNDNGNSTITPFQAFFTANIKL